MMTKAEREALDRWGGSHYDAENDRIVLTGNPPLYIIAHEHAHLCQHQERSWLYLLDRLLSLLHAPHSLRRVARLLLELDADRRVRALWTDMDEEGEALSRLLHTVWAAKLWP